MQIKNNAETGQIQLLDPKTQANFSIDPKTLTITFDGSNKESSDLSAHFVEKTPQPEPKSEEEQLERTSSMRKK